MEFTVLLLLLLLFGITPNFGFFSFPSFFLLIGVFMLFIVRLFIAKQKLPISVSGKILPFAGSMLLFYSSFYYGGLYQDSGSKTFGMVVMFIFALTTTIRWYVKHKPPAMIWLVIVFLFLSLLTLFGSPHPVVDTLVVLKEAPMMALRGLNPYSERFTQVYPAVDPTYYNYLPVSFLFLIPFVYIFNDPRYSIIVAVLIIALSIYRIIKISKKRVDPEWLVLIVLFIPRTFFMLEHVYLDPIIVSVFLIFSYLTITNRRVLSYVFLALFFSFKQTTWVTFPLFIYPFMVRLLKRSAYLIAFLSPFIVPVYYFFRNPSAFTQDALTGLSKASDTSPIYNSLTVQTFISRMGLHLGPFDGLVLPIIVTCAVYGLILWKKPRLSYSIALIVFSFYFFSYHAYFNVYYFVALFLVLDITLSHGDTI